MTRRLAPVALLAGSLLLLTGCGGHGSTASTAPSPTTARTPTIATTQSPTPVTARSPTVTPRADVWSSEPRRVERALPGTATVVAIRTGHNAAIGVTFDRLVIEFRDRVPGYDVRYVPEVRSAGQGAVVPLRGQAFLEVVLYPAVAHDTTGASTLFSPRVGGGLPALVQYRVAGDYEGYVHLGLGVDDRVGFQVHELANPPRLAIDIAS